MNVLSVFIWLSLATGLLAAIKYRHDYRMHLKKMVPYFVLGIVIVLLLGAGRTLKGVALGDNGFYMFANVVVLLRDFLLAGVGLMFLSRDGTFRTPRDWEKSIEAVLEVPTAFMLGVVVSYAVYTLALFQYFAPAIVDSKLEGFGHGVVALSLALLTPLSEEFLYRLFTIGTILFLLSKTTHRWVVAILVSSIIWSCGHWDVADLGWIKFVHIFPFGIVLGITLRRYGFEACLATHMFANVINGFAIQLA